MKKLIPVLLLSLLLTACTWYGEGTVLEKHYSSGYQYFVSCGKSMCPAYQEACYWMKVRERNGDEHDGCVRPGLWEKSNVGDYIKITADGS